MVKAPRSSSHYVEVIIARRIKWAYSWSNYSWRILYRGHNYEDFVGGIYVVYGIYILLDQLQSVQL